MATGQIAAIYRVTGEMFNLAAKAGDRARIDTNFLHGFIAMFSYYSKPGLEENKSCNSCYSPFPGILHHLPHET
jgi:hypothetical protein